MRRLWSLWASILAPVVAGCGGGTAIIAGGGSSSGGTVATTVSDVTVTDIKSSPAANQSDFDSTFSNSLTVFLASHSP